MSMKCSFYKGCFERFLTIEVEDNQLTLSSDSRQRDDWNKNLGLLKASLLSLILHLKEMESLFAIYRYHFESNYFDEINYDLPVPESRDVIYERIVESVTAYDLDKESYSFNEFLEIFKDTIESFPQPEDAEGRNSHTCDQCGDNNFEIFAEIP